MALIIVGGRIAQMWAGAEAEAASSAPPRETERQVRKIRAMLAKDGLRDAYAEAILRRMCTHRHRVPLQWARSECLGGVIASLSYLWTVNKRSHAGNERIGRKHLQQHARHAACQFANAVEAQLAEATKFQFRNDCEIRGERQNRDDSQHSHPPEGSTGAASDSQPRRSLCWGRENGISIGDYPRSGRR